MWRVLRGMYAEVNSCVIVDGEKSEWFESLIGVRQGCVLSPILYSVFVNGFARELIERGIGGVEVRGEVLKLLLFADDIVMFSETGEGLQEMLDVLAEYCKKWRFEINVKKSKVMVCGRKGVLEGETGSWSFDGKEVERVRTYKYVGVMVNEEGTWKDHVEKVLEKAKKLSRAMKSWLFRHDSVSVRAKLEVWRIMIASGMRYGSEVWWADKVETRKLEAVQMEVLRWLLKVSDSATNDFVRGEMGVFELERERHKAMLIWLGRLVGMKEGRWAKRMYNMKWERKGVVGYKRKSWEVKVGELVGKYQLKEELEMLGDGKLEMEEWRKVVYQKVEEAAIEDWKDGVLRGKKLDVYREVKQEWGFEAYLEGRFGRGERLMARFRSGSVLLGEELARWDVRSTESDSDEEGEGEAEEEVSVKRVRGACGACQGNVLETVWHVLMECEGYEEERRKWAGRVGSAVGLEEGGELVDPFKLMLGMKCPGMGEEEVVKVFAASSRLFVEVWEKRATITGPRYSRGVKDPSGYGTT